LVFTTARIWSDGTCVLPVTETLTTGGGPAGVQEAGVRPAGIQETGVRPAAEAGVSSGSGRRSAAASG